MDTSSFTMSFQKTLSGDKIIYQEGDSSQGTVYLLLGGWIELYRGDEEGNKACYGIVEAGSMFGEEALFGYERHYSASCFRQAYVQQINLSSKDDIKYQIPNRQLTDAERIA